MFITGLGVAVPPQRYTQNECWAALQASQPFAKLTPRSRAVLKKVLTGRNGIATRHLALEPLAEVFDLSPDTLHTRFGKHAPALAGQAGRRALDAAETGAARIDAVIVSTCTGYLCPGLTSYVSERLGLRPDVLALDLVGQGCGAAVPNLRMAEALVRSGRAGQVLSISLDGLQRGFLSGQRSRGADQRVFVWGRRGGGGIVGPTAQRSQEGGMETGRFGARAAGPRLAPL
jgi:alkylresorcinol/alkylpyrone synthase